MVQVRKENDFKQIISARLDLGGTRFLNLEPSMEGT